MNAARSGFAVLVLSATALLASCGGGGDASSGNAAATATIVSSRGVQWRVAGPVQTVLRDGSGATMSGATCVSLNQLALVMAADCSSATGLLVGDHTVRVSAGTVEANAVVRVMPQRHWATVGGSPGSSNLQVTRPDGMALAWGVNTSNSLGLGLADGAAIVTLPTVVKDGPGSTVALSSISRTFTGGGTSLAVLESGEVVGWGEQSFNALMNVRTGGTAAPVRLQNTLGTGPLTNVVQAGWQPNNGYALLDQGTVMAWGATLFSATGATTATNTLALPLPVLTEAGGAPLSNIVQVAISVGFYAALGQDGRVRLWGFRAAPDGASTQSYPRVLPRADGTELTGIVSIAAGAEHLLALHESGQVYAWGKGAYGVLGLSPTTWVSSPNHAQLVLDRSGTTPLANIAMVSASGFNSYAVDVNGQVLAWGFDALGALGCGANGCTTRAGYLPEYVVSESGTSRLSNVVSITGAKSSVLAMKADGTIATWGYRYQGTLGQGDNVTSGALAQNVPVLVRNVDGTGNLVLDPAAFPNLRQRYR